MTRTCRAPDCGAPAPHHVTTIPNDGGESTSTDLCDEHLSERLGGIDLSTSHLEADVET